MADWEALFAQASDIPTSNTPSSSSNPAELSSKRSNFDYNDDADDNNHDGRPPTNQKSKKKKKKHKRQRTSGRNSHDGCSAAYQKMLKSRLDPPPGPTTPWCYSWMTLEESFLDANTQYKTEEGSMSSTCTTTSDYHQKQNKKIIPIQPSKSKLQQSPLSFRLVVLSSEQHHSSQQQQRESSSCWHLRLFCHGRNLRCCAKLLILLLAHQWENDKTTTTMNEQLTHTDPDAAIHHKGSKQQTQRRRQLQKHQKSLFRNMQQEANNILEMTQSSFLAFLPQDEANLLLTKATEATGLVEKLLRQRKREQKKQSENARGEGQNTVPSWSFELCIRIIMACDALYYRLYYQQLTGSIRIIIPIDDGHDDDDSHHHIPHPQFYFGLEGLTIMKKKDGAADKTANVKSAQECKGSSPELAALVDHLFADDDAEDEKKGVAANHVLEAIHRRRFEETMSLFQNSSAGWASSSPNTLVQWQTSLSKHHHHHPAGDSQHETPAPQLLMDWRDSCRDFLCHLYAYATVSSKVLRQVRALLGQLASESMDLSKGIVEIGAGTGCLAEILRGQGMAVEAWDIQPPSSSSNSSGENRGGGMNEYHGHVPSFCEVQKASTFPSTSDAKRSALLLCYPPPKSPMALNTLSAYRKAGGKCLIHIGEFKGLTGDSNFEKALLKGDMQCIARHPCLGWGTDAAYVTVWITKGSRTKSVPSSPSVLLPCSATSCSKESTKRCRLCRQVAYCSKECYDEHTPTRNCLFSLFNIHTDPNLASFGSSKTFAPL